MSHQNTRFAYDESCLLHLVTVYNQGNMKGCIDLGYQAPPSVSGRGESPAYPIL